MYLIGPSNTLYIICIFLFFIDYSRLGYGKFTLLVANSKNRDKNLETANRSLSLNNRVFFANVKKKS